MQREIIKFTQSVMLGTAFALFLPLWAFAQTPEDVSQQALELAGQDKFQKALSILDNQNTDIRESYDVQFARARILAWSGEHEASAKLYNELLNTYPGNADSINGYAYLNYYRGDLDKAESLFNEVLVENPQYEDTQNGLKRVIAARIANRRAQQRWRIDTSSGFNSFDNGQQDWNHQNVRIEYVPGQVGVYGSVTRYERFGLSDVQMFAGIRSNSKKAFDWNIGAGFTPDADFRSEYSAQARFGYKTELRDGTVLHSSIGYQLDDYEFTGTIHQVTPQLMAYMDNGMVLTGRLIHVLQSDADNQTGFLISGASPVIDRFGARLGYANAPETVGGVVIDTETIFGGLTYQLSEQIEFHGTYSRDDRENTYISNGVNFGITQRY